jgi:hypothetical protein
MAIVTVTSDLFPTGPNLVRNSVANRDRAYHCASFLTFPVLTAAADIGSTYRIATLPANGRYIAGLSWAVCTAGGAGALFSVGLEAYKGVSGETILANPTFFGTALNVAAAGRPSLATLTGVVDEWDIPTDVVVTFTVAGANLPIGFGLKVFLGYLAAFVS